MFLYFILMYSSLNAYGTKVYDQYLSTIVFKFEKCQYKFTALNRRWVLYIIIISFVCVALCVIGPDAFDMHIPSPL